jgi:5-methylthioribose kinase
LIKKHYSSQNILSPTLVQRFAGIEIIRRILGVAQLPLKLSEKEQIEILEEARRMLIN